MLTPELVQTAQRGNLLAFNHMMLEYQDTIYDLVCRLLSREELVDAAILKVNQRLYNDLPSFRDGDFYLWMLKVLVKVCRPAMRKNRTKIVDNLSSPVCLAYLPASLRLVIVLVDFAGLDYSQTASILRISKRTVCRRLSKARRFISISMMRSQEEFYIS